MALPLAQLLAKKQAIANEPDPEKQAKMSDDLQDQIAGTGNYAVSKSTGTN
jgi:hypothetical protein